MARKRLTKQRLLFVRKTTTETGGADIVILDLLKGIDYETNVVSIATQVDVFSHVLVDYRLPVKSVPLTAPFVGTFPGMFMSWIRYFVRLCPDKIVLAEGWFGDFPLSATLAAFVISRANVWMIEFHPAPERINEDSRVRSGLIPASLRERARDRCTKGILSISYGIKDRLVRGYGYAAEKIGVVYCGVDTKHFSPPSPEARSAMRQDLQIPEEALVVVSSARLHPIKRLDRLIQAFGTLSAERRDLWLLLTGEGPSRAELENVVQSVNNRENVRFLGHVEDVCPILRASDIYVLPSDEEGFGIALVEAMACELVCVATKTVGPSEIITEGVNGFLTDLTYEAVLKGLDKALRLGQRERQAMGKRARQTVVENFRVEEATAKGLTFMQIDSAAALDS
jgi:glycosyltransferase involved in cell wall biosynthesis